MKNILLSVVAIVSLTMLAGCNNDSATNVVESTGITWTAHRMDVANLYRVTYGNGLFVAFGDTSIVTSPDGITWTHRVHSGTFSSLGDICYGNGKYIIVTGTNVILTSSDGIIWTQRTSGTTKNLTGVTYANGMYVAVGNAVILTSSDGIAWTQRVSDTTCYVSDVAYGNNIFVAVGFKTQMTSTDGITWTNNFSSLVPNQYSHNVMYGDGMFIGYTDGSYNGFLLSTDGITWTPTYASYFAGSTAGLIYGNDWFVSVGSYGIITSPDGISRSLSSIIATDRYDVAYGNGKFVAVGVQKLVFTGE